MQENNAIYQMRFPRKLWHLIHLRNEAIFWGGTGKTILLNFQLLNDYLKSQHSVFKTNNLSSFMRQLNMYGFRKVTSHLQDPLCNSNNPHIFEYIHNCFQHGKPGLLHKITRKDINRKKAIITKPTHMPISSLQKARGALQIALKKAAQDLSIKNSTKFYHNFYFQCKDSPKTYGAGVNKKGMKTYKETTNPFDELGPDDARVTPHLASWAPLPLSFPSGNQEATIKNGFFETNIEHEEPFLCGSTEYYDELSKKDNGVDVEPKDHPKSPVIELLAEYHVDEEVDEGIIMKSIQKIKNENPLNCVLPFTSNNDNDAKIIQNNVDLQDEWDLMLSQQTDLPSFDIFKSLC